MHQAHLTCATLPARGVSLRPRDYFFADYCLGILLAAVAPFAVCGCGAGNDGPAPSASKNQPSSAAVLNEQISPEESVKRILEECPAPLGDVGEDAPSRRRVMKAMHQVASFDLDVIRSTIQNNYDNNDHLKALDTSGRSKIYVLNRVLFNVPADPCETFPGGFLKSPGDKDSLIWPLEVGPDGGLVFTGSMSGYSGGEYFVLSEFDNFRALYGRRKGAPMN